MGAWGVGSFENDDAMDWLGDFADGPSVAAVTEALATVAGWDEAEYLEEAEAGAALAAAEVVAAMAGRPSPDLPAGVAEWVGRRRAKVNPRLMPLALRAVARVRSNSELSECWADEGTGQEWHKAVEDLETRLAQAAV